MLCKHVYAVLIELSAKHVDLGAERRTLDVEAQDVREVQASLDLDGQASDDDLDLETPDDVEPDDEDDEPRTASQIVLHRNVPGRQLSTRAAPSARDWRARLEWLREPPTPERLASVTTEIEYVLNTIAAIDPPGDRVIVPTAMNVLLHRRDQKKDGTITGRRPLAIDIDAPTWNVSSTDRALLERLLGCTPDLYRPYQPPHPYTSHADPAGRTYLRGATVHPTAAERVVPALCETGRFGYVATGQLHPLSWDADAPFTARLRAEPRGASAKLHLELVRGDEVLAAAALSFACTTYLIADNRLIRVDGCDDLWRWVTAVGREPLQVRSNALPSLIETVGAARAAPALALEALGWSSSARTPVPRLYLEPIANAPRLSGRLAFGYGDLESDGSGMLVDRAARQIIVRDHVAEDLARTQLAELPGRVASERYYGEAADVILDVARIGEAIAVLQGGGWELYVRNRRVRAGARLKAKVTSTTDWFDVALGIDADGVGADVPELLRALREGSPFVRLSDGTIGLVATEWLAHHRHLLTLGRDGADGVRVPRAAAPLLDAMLTSLPEVELDASFEKLRARLALSATIEPGRAPRGFRGSLRPYQRDGLGWFRFLDELGLGGCLADDMGLGKTVQALALLMDARRAGRPSLVVAPKSVVFNWLDEARRFAPKLRVVDYTGRDRATRRAELASADLIVTSYAILRLDAEELAGWDLEYAILDEAQAIKNPSARLTQAARGLRARRRLALTGTPVENHLGDLASILEFLNPGLVDSSGALRALLETKPGDTTDLSPLARALRPFLLRRTKDQVLTELPERTEQILHCQLGAEQRRQYDQLASHYRASLLPQVSREGVARNAMNVLAALLRLRQAACHPALLDPTRASAPSAKLDALLEHIVEATESGHKALVFSQFTSFLALVRARLDAAGLTYEYLDGKTRDRKSRVQRFTTDPACRIFLISLKAGGTGLNLTAADYVYLLDPWWNPAVEAQAIDRTHRMGQARPVFAYRLIAEGTVEDKILALQAKKRALAAGIFADDGAGLAKLTAADLDLLFS